MADQPVFKRTFEHQDWTDNVDRVQADGPNGFNIRFHSLEAEFDNLYSISAQFRDALATLGGIVRRLVTLTFTPSFFGPTQPAGGGAQVNWTLIDGAAISPAGNTNLLEGWLPLQLPDGMQAQNVIVFGQKKGSLLSFQITLVQQSVADPTQQQTMSVIKLANVPDGLFQSTPSTIPDNLKLIENSKFKYLLFATLAPASTPADPTATARINAIQVVCGLP
jgi:hypothetical protein